MNIVWIVGEKTYNNFRAYGITCISEEESLKNLTRIINLLINLLLHIMVFVNNSNKIRHVKPTHYDKGKCNFRSRLINNLNHIVKFNLIN